MVLAPRLVVAPVRLDRARRSGDHRHHHLRALIFALSKRSSACHPCQVAEQRIIVDHVIVVCKGCRGERTYYPDANLTGAQALIAWIDTKLTPCACGAETCDVKAHLKNPEILEETLGLKSG